MKRMNRVLLVSALAFAGNAGWAQERDAAQSNSSIEQAPILEQSAVDEAQQTMRTEAIGPASAQCAEPCTDEDIVTNTDDDDGDQAFDQDQDDDGR
jgi:hypothetical protein